MNSEAQHSAAQIEQAAQHCDLLMGELKNEIDAAALRVDPWPHGHCRACGAAYPAHLAGCHRPEQVVTLSARIEELCQEFVGLREMLARHVAILRGLVS